MVLLTWMQTRLHILCHLNVNGKDLYDLWVMWFNVRNVNLEVNMYIWTYTVEQRLYSSDTRICDCLYCSLLCNFPTVLNIYTYPVLCPVQQCWKVTWWVFAYSKKHDDEYLSCHVDKVNTFFLFVKLNSVVLYVYLFMSLSSIIIVAQWVIDPTFPQHGCGWLTICGW